MVSFMTSYQLHNSPGSCVKEVIQYFLPLNPKIQHGSTYISQLEFRFVAVKSREKSTDKRLYPIFPHFRVTLSCAHLIWRCLPSLPFNRHLIPPPHSELSHNTNKAHFSLLLYWKIKIRVLFPKFSRTSLSISISLQQKVQNTLWRLVVCW